MSDITERFIKGFTDYHRKSRRNSQFFNRMISEKKFLRIHPIIIPNQSTDVLVGFADTNTFVYPAGDDLQREVFQFMEQEGWSTFLSTGFSEDEMVEFLPETLYIETSKFTAIELTIPTWNDLLNAPKVGDADFGILQETFEEFHAIEDKYDQTMDLHELFCHPERKPTELELRIVWEDMDTDRKYGNSTVLVYWKGEFMALCNEYISRYRANHSFYIANVEAWKEMMKVLFELANIEEQSPIRGAEILDMTQLVENIAYVPGFTEKDYGA